MCCLYYKNIHDFCYTFRICERCRHAKWCVKFIEYKLDVCAFSGSEVLQHRDTETLSRLFNSIYKTVHVRQFDVLQIIAGK